MSYQSALLTECFITHLTAIRVITIMYASMSYQGSLATECLITHLTAIRAFTTIYITGMCAFSTVYVKFFIPSTLEKIKKVKY